MSFARAPRGSLFDKEIKNKENLPGPDKYNPKWSNVSLSFVKIAKHDRIIHVYTKRCRSKLTYNS